MLPVFHGLDEVLDMRTLWLVLPHKDFDHVFHYARSHVKCAYRAETTTLYNLRVTLFNCLFVLKLELERAYASMSETENYTLIIVLCLFFCKAMDNIRVLPMKDQ